MDRSHLQGSQFGETKNHGFRSGSIKIDNDFIVPILSIRIDHRAFTKGGMAHAAAYREGAVKRHFFALNLHAGGGHKALGCGLRESARGGRKGRSIGMGSGK